jgi:hypothetical protein
MCERRIPFRAASLDRAQVELTLGAGTYIGVDADTAGQKWPTAT